MPPDTAHLQAGPYSKRGRLRGTAKVRLLTLANLDSRTRSARTARHMVEAFKRALGARYSPAVKPLVEAAACAQDASERRQACGAQAQASANLAGGRCWSQRTPHS